MLMFTLPAGPPAPGRARTAAKRNRKTWREPPPAPGTGPGEQGRAM